MKKLLSLLVAIVMTSSLFATDYYLTVKSNNTAEGEVSFSESSGFSEETTNTKMGSTTNSTKSFYVKAKTGKQFAYAKSNYSTNTWYINSSTSSMWSASPTWRSGSGTQMFTVKVSNLGMTSAKTNCIFTIYFKDLNVLTFKNEDGTTLKTYQLRDNEATPSTSDLFSIRPTKAEDANYTYSFKGWYNGNTEYAGGYGKYITSNQTYTAVFTATPKATKYTVTINTPSNGTLQVKNGNNILSSGAQVDENTTLTIVTTNSTAHYHCSSVSVLNGSTPVSVNNNQFTLTSNVTVDATFVEDDKYTVNITTPENGTISVMNGSTPVKSGDQVYTGTVLTVTATGDTENHYVFKSWNDGTPELTNSQFTLTSDVTIGAEFELAKYTIRFYLSKTDKDNDVEPIGTRNTAHGNAIIFPGNDAVINILDENDPNNIHKDIVWLNVSDDSEAPSTATGDADYYATYTTVEKVRYTITIGALTNGSVTITTDGGTEVVPATGGNYKYEEGTTVILNAIAERGYHFTTWSDGTENAKKRIASLEANTTLTPTFAVNTPFELRDAWTESDCQNNYDMDNVLTITLTDRTFKQNEWATISLPFNCTLTQGDDMYGYIYKFGKVTLAADGGSINVEFNRTYEITANEPYLVVTQENITAPKFYGVSLVSPESVSLSSDGQVSFVSNLWKMTINGPRDFYVGNRSALRYAKTTGTVINANRAFFRKSETAPSPRRMVIVIDGVETNMEISEDGDIVETQDTRKYIENGALIIERGGVRYNATGAVAQ